MRRSQKTALPGYKNRELTSLPRPEDQATIDTEDGVTTLEMLDFMASLQKIKWITMSLGTHLAED